MKVDCPWWMASCAPMRVKTRSTSPISAGERYVVNGLPAIGTGESFLVFDSLQPEGKKPMTGQAFLNGQPGWLEDE